MDDLDFSGLTDDQLISLARACCIEALQRSPAASNAMLDMMRDEAAAARLKADLLQDRDSMLLEQAGQLVGRAPADISLLHVYSRGRRRVYINEGPYRYSRSHLVDYDTMAATISTVAALRERRRELIEFCAGLAAVVPLDTHIA
ncbi:hypothetical protein [Achromobacter sp. 413638]|uniref:hypothetical protein n=1 Tax=Achromobacter sp. 413638 TaxID=3342385 RepID=UPI00370CB3C3